MIYVPRQISDSSKLLICMKETKTDYRAGRKKVSVFKCTWVSVLTCPSVSLKHLCLMTDRKQLRAPRKEYACFPPFKSRTNWSGVLSQFKANNMMDSGRDFLQINSHAFFRWNAAGTSAARGLTNRCCRAAQCRENTEPAGSWARPGAPEPCSSAGESALLNQAEL